MITSYNCLGTGILNNPSVYRSWVICPFCAKTYADVDIVWLSAGLHLKREVRLQTYTLLQKPFFLQFAIFQLHQVTLEICNLINFINECSTVALEVTRHSSDAFSYGRHVTFAIPALCLPSLQWCLLLPSTASAYAFVLSEVNWIMSNIYPWLNVAWEYYGLK